MQCYADRHHEEIDIRINLSEPVCHYTRATNLLTLGDHIFNANREDTIRCGKKIYPYAFVKLVVKNIPSNSTFLYSTLQFSGILLSNQKPPNGEIIIVNLNMCISDIRNLRMVK